MNYFAHGFAHIDRPYFAAGTILPDWLAAHDRACRLRKQPLEDAIASTPASPERELLEGARQHLIDDVAFHRGETFLRLCELFSAEMVGESSGDTEIRMTLVGHILIELLLDAWIVEHDPERLDRYYEALASVRGVAVARAMGEVLPADAAEFTRVVARFASLRFLYDYRDDDRLLWRLAQVLRRVGFAPLPEDFARVVPQWRRRVAAAGPELLAPTALAIP